MKHIIFGGFDYAVRYEMDQDAIYTGIDYFVDNNPDLIGTTYLGKEIKHPDALLNENKENILILIGSIVYRAEIALQLKCMGFDEEKHFIWGIAFAGNSECRRLWKHTEWKDHTVSVENSQNSEASLACYKYITQIIDWAKTSTIIDLGSLNERVRAFLPAGVQYIPVDYVKITDNTVVCNLNKYEFPLTGYDPQSTTILSIGNIGFCSDWKWYLRTVSEQCNCFILTHADFHRLARENRRTEWTRYNALFDHEIIRYMLELGFDFVDAIDFRLRTTIFKFVKRG